MSDTYPTGPHVVVTSPAYPNGMSDHFHSTDGSRRHTYRQSLADTIGYDRPLRVTNMGRYSVRAGRLAETLHYDIASCAVRRWPNWAIVNVSDFVAAGKIYPLADRWQTLLEHDQYRIDVVAHVVTPRLRHGANADLRTETEAVIVAHRELT